MKKHLAFLIISSSLTAFAADPAATNSATPAAGTAAGTTSATATAPAAGSSPAAVCKSIVESTKNKNYQAVMAATTGMPPQKKSAKSNKAFQKMSGTYFDQLQDMTCGNEMVTKDHAVVEADSKGEKRLIPFTMTNEGWKFNFKAYQSFYETNQKGAKKSM